jgi:hypothetical protein
MKARFTLILLLSFLSYRVSAQEWVEGGLYAEHYQLGTRAQQQYGGQLHIGLGERFTLNWQIGIGPAMDGGFYFHAPAGLIGGYKLMREQSTRPLINVLPWANNLGLLLCALPEGVGYYATDGKMRMHVSLNPLGFDYWNSLDGSLLHGRMVGTMMIRCRLMSNLKFPIYIAPQIGASFIYRLPEDGTLERIGFRAGVTIGLSSEDRE